MLGGNAMLELNGLDLLLLTILTVLLVQPEWLRKWLRRE